MPSRKFNITAQQYTQAGRYEVVQNCNCITVTNLGNAIAYFNGMILHPGTVGSTLGDSRTIGGNEGEIYKGELVISFDSGSTPKVEVIQKYYTE